MTKKVAILYGGLSTEREVSLNTGKSIFDALKDKDFDTVLIDAGRDLSEKLREIGPDVAVIALHGKYGEDGCVQGLLEILGIPYTGPGVMACSLAMNKIMTKKIFIYENIPTPEFLVIDGKRSSPVEISQIVLNKMKLPVVIKSASQGSSIGVCFAFQEDEVKEGIVECLKYDNEILVEQFIKGRELTVSVMGNSDPVVLPILEIVSQSGLYDYHAKYTTGASSHFAAELPEAINKEIRGIAARAYRAVGCRGLSRVDFLLSENNEPYVLEINTSPGMTATSLFPDAARAAGISFPDLIERLINYAFQAPNT
ncbi:D-alanine--D-alanine ligase [Phosphitispora fastidiosa]|uniref:D-alanine--D-alanine ligase n=1 Tax=Phosphitispora fastidiosa TaxID=2837202 RepID=UPI001E3BD225|nr:D-alanine--D-alanine ligase [Phosphitispora fastidiosa]MBU7005361.1 D-alanine-D-alanine ligase [Phosphitispora fastidiosa]